MNTRAVVGLAVVVGAGVGVRTLPQRSLSHLAASWPWATAAVTLYIPEGDVIVPVSRRIPRNADVPRAALQALLAGPAASTGLHHPIPPGIQIRSFDVIEGVARVDLSSPEQAAFTRTAEMAIIETLTSVPGIASVSISVDGKHLTDRATRTRLLYYASANGLVAVPSAAATPREALTAYLSRPPDPDLIRLPSDVRLLDYQHETGRGSLSLNFAYTGSVRTLALVRPDRMRLVLLGLIASLTEFPSVRGVRLDFEGQTRLGLGQCSDLLRAIQPRPELLNDERLLGR